MAVVAGTGGQVLEQCRIIMWKLMREDAEEADGTAEAERGRDDECHLLIQDQMCECGWNQRQ